MYNTRQIGGMHIMIVDEGTKITDERSNTSYVVEENTWITKGNLIYCTEKSYQVLLKKLEKIT